MGQFPSSRRRRENNPPPPPPTPYQFISSSPPPPPPPPPRPSNPPLPVPHTPPPPPRSSSFAFAANAPYPSPHYPPSNPYPAPQTPPFYSQYSPAFSNPSANAARLVGPPPPPSQSAFPPQPPLPYVVHEKTTTVKSDINLHKTTIRLEVDQQFPDTHLVSFSFDAMVDGSRITIYYFAKEGVNCSFSSLYPDITPVKVPFRKGLGQKFRQPSGTGIDLGFFELDDLSKPTSNDVFPLVISAEACSLPLLMDEQLGHPPPTLGHAQITQAIIEKKNDEPFQVKVVKQILWIDGVHYELRELFGIGNLSEAEFDDSDPGKECVICMSEPKDTAVLPCRHMCMCRECAKVLRFQTNKCPICRQPVEQLIEIKVKNDSP